MIELSSLPKNIQQQLGASVDTPDYDPIKNYDFDKDILKTGSMYHQFVDYKDRVVKRYAKTSISALSFFRSHPTNRKIRIGCVLQTDMPDEWYPYVGTYTDDVFGGPCTLNIWRYESDVIELYDFDDIALFERWNAKLLEEGKLIEYYPGTSYSYNNKTGDLMDGDYTEIERPTATVVRG